jgi:hypothetical protein
MNQRRRARTVEPVNLARLERGLGEFLVEFSLTSKTRDGYEWQWRRFMTWCTERGVDPVSAKAGDVVSFVAWLASPLVDEDQQQVHASLAASTINAYLCAIRYHLALSGQGSAAVDAVDVKEIMRGVRRVAGKTVAAKRALGVADVRALLVAPQPSLMDLQERAALLLARESKAGWARLVTVRRDQHVFKTNTGYQVRLPEVVTDMKARRGTWRVRDPQVADAARVAAGFTSWTGGTTPGPRSASGARGVAGCVTEVVPGFVAVVGKGQKACQRALAEHLAATLDIPFDELFMPAQKVGIVVRAPAFSVDVPHRHQELSHVLGVLFAELACPACALDLLLEASPADHPWIFGWSQARNGAMVPVKVLGQPQVRQLARSLEGRWAFTADRLGMDRAVAGVCSTMASLDVWRLVAASSNDFLVYLRDRAYVLTGWHGAFGRSDLMGLRHEQMTLARDQATGTTRGVVIALPHGSRDPEGEGARVALQLGHDPMLCAVRALSTYLAATGTSDGAVFVQLSGKLGAFGQGKGRLGDQLGSQEVDGAGRGMVQTLFDRLCERAGMARIEWGSESLRTGYVVTALAQGATTSEILAKTRYVSPASIERHGPSTAPGRDVAREVLS